MSDEYRFYGVLVKNELDRYELYNAMLGYPYEYTSGDAIEYWNQEKSEWVKSSVEHFDDYYIVDLGKDVPIEGIIVRVK